MRTNLKYVWMLAAALVLGVTSCNKDDDGGPEDGGVVAGQDTWMQVSFKSPVTYADNPVDGTVEESKIATVDVFIYDAAGTLINNRQLSDFTEAGGVWTSPSNVPAKTGSVQIYVAVNLPADVRSAMLGGNINAVKTAEYAVTVAGIATDNKFVMANAIESATLEEWDGIPANMPAANKISTEVTRLAAKFTVEKASSLSLTGIDGGQITDMEFGVGQLNTKTLYIKNLVAGVIEGANHTKATTSAGLTGIPTDYITVNNFGLTNQTLKAVYSPENTNDKTGSGAINGIPKSGNLTYYAVKAQFYPDQDASYTASALTVNPANTNPATDDFYVVKVEDNNDSGNVLNLYFYNETEANDFVTAGSYVGGGIDYTVTSVAPVKYNESLCYYTVYVNFGNDYDVYRNDFYRSTITKISGLGDPAPGPKDPELPPVDGRTDIEMSITVEPWNLVPSYDELSPQ